LRQIQEDGPRAIVVFGLPTERLSKVAFNLPAVLEKRSVDRIVLCTTASTTIDVEHCTVTVG
jgi:hypothetical protein